MPKDTQNDGLQNHLTLSCFPSCENCLAWSEDALAFAGDTNVYLVRKNPDAAGAQIWTKDSLRVDTFTHADRSVQNLSTISELFLGKEQSEPIITALAWSSPGLGLHRRAVLAVLTSNLQLAIWETNGVQRGWRRSCIVNDHMSPPNDQANLQISRASHQIRSFAWSYPLIRPTKPKEISHFLAVVDCHNNLLFYSIAKKGKHDYGQWSVRLLCMIKIDLGGPPHDTTNKTKLQQILHSQSPVSSVSISKWQYITTNAKEASSESRAVVSCYRPRGSQSSALSFEIRVTSRDFASDSTATLKQLFDSELSQNEGYSEQDKPSLNILYQLDDKSVWREALTGSYHDYNNRNHLDELIRLRFWGHATSPNGDFEATAVTLHPWDMYEYTPPASERCHVAFRSLQSLSLVAKPCIESEEVVLETTLDYIIRQITVHKFRWNEIDRKVVRGYHALASSRTSAVTSRDILKRILEDTNSAENGNVGVNAQHTDIANLSAETCTMCGSTIEMRLPIASASCQTGHIFTRCSLSLVVIQEPRISKHCSGCRRHFLDISKLGRFEGPSLAGDLFDEFDVCPYCHQKFEG